MTMMNEDADFNNWLCGHCCRCTTGACCAVVARHIPEGGGLKEDVDWELDTARPRIQMQSLQSLSEVAM